MVPTMEIESPTTPQSVHPVKTTMSTTTLAIRPGFFATSGKISQLLLEAALCATKEHDANGEHKYVEGNERNRSVQQRLFSQYRRNNRKADKPGITENHRKAIRALCSLGHTKDSGNGKRNNNRHRIHGDGQAHKRKRIGNARQLHIVTQRRRKHQARQRHLKQQTRKLTLKLGLHKPQLGDTPPQQDRQRNRHHLQRHARKAHPLPLLSILRGPGWPG